MYLKPVQPVCLCFVMNTNDHLKFWIWFQNIFQRIILAGHVCFLVACLLIFTGFSVWMCWFSQRLTLLIICARPRVMILYLFIGSVILPRAVTWTLCVTKNWHIRVTVMNFLIDPSLGPITTHKSGPASVHLLTEQTCWRDGVESTMWHVYTKLDTNTGENSPVLLVACEVYRHINPLGKCILVSILAVLRVWIWKWNHEQSRFLNKFTRERRKKEAYGTLPGINNKYLNSKT